MQNAQNKLSDQIARTNRLISRFDGYTCQKVRFLTLLLNFSSISAWKRTKIKLLCLKHGFMNIQFLHCTGIDQLSWELFKFGFAPFRKGIYSSRKEFVPKGCEGVQNNTDVVASP